ncbi:hypothetical protein DEA8626_03273 [Defluviimonas aquaemixtae]|uniref:PhnB-like domain-containing protein n=1 Tax=Albidovulum aquaemixtae TaxID=1542388 RepID=A0A2R8BLB0_9RHOB|nr:VOC family protein [Defluviimonas aquaemixtae]SPH24223.1 hypothetical protein DEA8626_03273 [Defluviimonas aquaemixtae]
MSFSPYLHFQGTCAEAMRMYADLFGATDLTLIRYSEAPEEAGLPKGSDRIMHAHMTVGGSTLMASDFPEGIGDPQKAVSVSFSVPDAATGEAIYERLLKEGDEIMAYGETFWSPGFGMVRDKFGTHWMISVPGEM